MKDFILFLVRMKLRLRKGQLHQLFFKKGHDKMNGSFIAGVLSTIIVEIYIFVGIMIYCNYKRKK